MAREGEGHGDGRVYMGAGEVAYGVDRGHYRKAEGEADPQRADPSAGDLVHDDRARAGEDQQEGADELGGAAPQLVSSNFVSIGCRWPAPNAQRRTSPAGPRVRHLSKLHDSIRGPSGTAEGVVFLAPKGVSDGRRPALALRALRGLQSLPALPALALTFLAQPL